MESVLRALVVQEAAGARAAVAAELRSALELGDFETDVAAHADARDLLMTGRYRPDVLLVPSSLGNAAVARLCAAADGTGVAVMVYLDGNLELLEACVREGMHYLVPPFRGSLLRAQLICTAERRRLAGAARKAELVARLRDAERELEIAREIQTGFLPSGLPEATGWELAARFQPALQVAGDFYDAYPSADGTSLILTIADICDKGVGAALYTALIRTLLRHGIQQPGGDAAPETATVARIVAGANRYLAANHGRQGYFATVFCAELDLPTGRLHYVNAGHNPPLLRRTDAGIERLPTTGPAVGVVARGEFLTGRADLGPGDTLLLFTDGVTDARDRSGTFFGEQRLLAGLAQPVGSPGELLDRIEARMKHHVGAEDQYDDVTMLAVHRTGG